MSFPLQLKKIGWKNDFL